MAKDKRTRQELLDALKAGDNAAVQWARKAREHEARNETLEGEIVFLRQAQDAESEFNKLVNRMAMECARRVLTQYAGKLGTALGDINDDLKAG